MTIEDSLFPYGNFVEVKLFKVNLFIYLFILTEHLLNVK